MQPNLIFAAVLGVSSLLVSSLSQAEQSATFVARNSVLEQRATERVQAQNLAKSGESASKTPAKPRQSETTRDS